MHRDYGYYEHFSTLAAAASSTATIVVKVASGVSRMLTNIASATADTLDSVISNNTYEAGTTVTTGPPVPSMSVWALAALSVILLLTFSGRVRRRIVRPFGWRLVSRRPPRRSPECRCPIWTS